MRTLLAVAVLLGLVGCMPVRKTAWEHYDACPGTFVSMADCGKQKRTAWCATADNCGAEGEAIVRYVDSLKNSVERREMTDPEATRRWLEYRNAVIQRAATEQIATAPRPAPSAPAPMTCTTYAGITNCF